MLVFHYVVRRKDTETPFGIDLTWGPTPDECGHVHVIDDFGLVSLKNQRLGCEEAYARSHPSPDLRMAQHDFQRLQPGDRVVEINGSSNVEDMRIIMSTELILHIKVERLQETLKNDTEIAPRCEVCMVCKCPDDFDVRVSSFQCGHWCHEGCIDAAMDADEVSRNCVKCEVCGKRIGDMDGR